MLHKISNIPFYKLLPAFIGILLAVKSAVGPVGNAIDSSVSLLYAYEQPANHSELEALFSSYNYDWDTLNEGVPLIFLETLPGDLNRIPQVTKKKTVFFLSLLPVVLRANDEIREQKNLLESLLQRYDEGQDLSAEEFAQVAAIANEYKVFDNPLDNPKARKTLLLRVDILPTSLVLAQAATESAYGTSRFTQLGNNLFGEWTFDSGSGIIPNEREEGQTHELRCFSSLYDSVSSYMRNLNTHRAYRPLRELRARMREEGLPLRGERLATGLTRYSQRGAAYVRQIQSIIRANRLSQLSSVALRENPDEQSEQPLKIADASREMQSPAMAASRLSALKKNP